MRRIARPAVASSSDPMATPTTRLTIAVANFCSSGAPELNGYTTAISVTSPMIQRKNSPGLGVLSTPQPTVFFRWIIGLVTLIAVVYPFSSGAPLDQKFATAAVNLVLGVAIGSLLTATSARAIVRNAPRPSVPVGASDPGAQADPYGQRGYEQQQPVRPTYNEVPNRPTSSEAPTRPTYTPGTRPDDGWQ